MRYDLVGCGLKLLGFLVFLFTGPFIAVIAILQLGIRLQGQASIDGILPFVEDKGEAGMAGNDFRVGMMALSFPVRTPGIDDEMPVRRLLVGNQIGIFRCLHPLAVLHHCALCDILCCQLTGRVIATDRQWVGADTHIGCLRADNLLEQLGTDAGFGNGPIRLGSL